jgi:hypothetical protein
MPNKNLNRFKKRTLFLLWLTPPPTLPFSRPPFPLLLHLLISFSFAAAVDALLQTAIKTAYFTIPP